MSRGHSHKPGQEKQKMTDEEVERLTLQNEYLGRLRETRWRTVLFIAASEVPLGGGFVAGI